MDDARDIAQDCQEDVDEEVGIATALKEDTKRWEDDGENDLADVAISPKGQPCSTPITFFEFQLARLKHNCGRARKQ